MDPLTGLAIGTGAGMVEGLVNARFAEDRQHQAQDFSASQYATRYQTTVKDMQAAGLNPMLAYMQGAGSAPSSSAASAQGARLEPMRIYNETKIASAQEGNIIADTQKKESEKELLESQKEKTDKETLVQEGVPALNAAYLTQAISSAKQAQAYTEYIRKDIEKVDYEISSLKSQIEKNKQDVRLNKALEEAQWFKNNLHLQEAYLTKRRAELTEKETDILDPKARAAKTVTGESAAIADNLKRIGEAADTYKDILMPLPKFGTFPKKVGGK